RVTGATAPLLPVELLELALEPRPESRRITVRDGGWRRGGRGRGPHPPTDDDDEAGGRRQHRRGRRQPRGPVEATARWRRQDLLAVPGGERGQDLIAGLAARESLRDLLLHGLAGPAVEVVAGVHREAAAALAGESLLDLLLGRACDGGRRRRHQQRQQQRS